MKVLPRVTGIRASSRKRLAGETSWERVYRQQAVSKYSDIGEEDHILLNKSHHNKLSPNFEPVPHKVVEKKGNFVLVQDKEGNTKLCNASHMKMFIQSDSVLCRVRHLVNSYRVVVFLGSRVFSPPAKLLHCALFLSPSSVSSCSTLERA